MLFKEKELEEIRTFIDNEICFDELEKNKGFIYETGVIVRNEVDEYDITIGITYEDADICNEEAELNTGEKLKEWYFYNIFADEEYINLIGESITSIEDKFSIDVFSSIRDTISELLEEDK